MRSSGEQQEERSWYFHRSTVAHAYIRREKSLSQEAIPENVPTSFGLREAHPLQHRRHFLRLKQLLKRRKKIFILVFKY